MRIQNSDFDPMRLGGTAHAESNTISTIIRWQGQIFPVDIGELRFLGALEGIMYVETAQGVLNLQIFAMFVATSIEIFAREVNSACSRLGRLQ